MGFCLHSSHHALFYHSGITFYHALLTNITRLLCYLLLILGLSLALSVPFKQVVSASESATPLSSPYVYCLWDNNKRLPATLTAWKEVDLTYTRLFPYDHARQPHPPAGCAVLPAISHNIYKQGIGITTPSAILMLRCRERIDLLRPVRWVRSRLRAQNRQGYLLVSIPEMGIMNVQVHIVAVRSSSFNPDIVNITSASSRPVIGIFIRHTMNVRQYTFKDTITGKIDRIKATPNHPFYVVNRQRYIPVSHLSPYDKLVNVLGHPVTLVCPKGKSSHCGQPYHPGQVIPVYNLEVYGQHRYFVGKPGIMVHNGYKSKSICEVCGKDFIYPSKLKRHSVVHSDERPYQCKTCNKEFKTIDNLRIHIKTHTDGKPYKCGTCKEEFTSQYGLRRHYERTHMDNASPEETEQTRERSRSPINPIISQFDDLPEALPLLQLIPHLVLSTNNKQSTSELLESIVDKL